MRLTDLMRIGEKKENRKKNRYLISNRVKERNQIEPISDRKEYERTLTLTLVSHSDEPEKNNSNQKGESGGRIYLAVRRMNLRRRGRRSRAGGVGSPGSAKGALRPGRSTAACSPVGEHARRRKDGSVPFPFSFPIPFFSIWISFSFYPNR